MRLSRWTAVPLGCAIIALAVAWYSGSRFEPSAPRPAAGTVALGPEAGEPVARYLARLPADLPAPGVETLALVQFAAELSPAEALATVGVGRDGIPAPVTAVLRVPLPRVQTALHFEVLEPGVPPATALRSARERSRRTAAAGAARLTGRQGAVAAAEAAALADPSCRCVLAVVVRADRTRLVALAAGAGVRAVHAAPVGTVPVELALAPLLPEQTESASPLPDDGPIPPA